MNIRNFYQLILSMILIGGSVYAVDAPGRQTPQRPAQDPTFKISDEELKMLNLDEKEAQELQQFFDALNNLTPDQKKELEELGRATEEKMRKQGLDPNNMDDLMKFMETEGLTQPQAKPQPPVKKAPPVKKPMKPAVKPEIISVVSPADTKTMLNDLIDRIASLRQKAITRKKLFRKLEPIQDKLAQLNFYLNVLRSPELIKLLTSKDFIALHTTIQNLHKSFMSYEPSITARKISDVLEADDPYEILDLPYNATPKELEEQFVQLKAARSPEAVKAELIKEGCDEELCKIPIKAARRTFALIEQAYTKLKDPKSRASIDKNLRDKIARETQRENQSLRAFDKLFPALSSAFTMEGILEKTHQLIEKHKPEELKQMQAQLELEKKVFERSQKRVLVPQVRVTPARGRADEPYGEFYREMSRKARQRPYRPRPTRRDRPMPGRPGVAPAVAKPEKKEDKKDEKKKKKDDDKKKKDKKDKKDAVKPADLSKEDIKKLSSIDQAGDILGSWKKKKGKITVQRALRGAPPQDIEYTFDKLVNRLEDELLVSPKAEDMHAVADLDTYFKEHKIYDLEKTLAKAAPAKGKKLPTGVVTDEWKDKVAPHAKTIKKWHKKLSTVLDPVVVANRPDKNRYRDNKRLHYGLLVPSDGATQKYKRPDDKDKPIPPAPAGIHLGELYTTINNVNTYVESVK